MRNQTDSLLTRTKKSLRGRDVDTVVAEMKQFIDQEPIHWKQLMSLEGVLPHPPKIARESKELEYWHSIHKSLVNDTSLSPKVRQSINNLFNVMFGLTDQYGKILNKQSNLNFFKHSPASRILGIARFVESQLYIANTKVNELGEQIGYYELPVLLTSNIPATSDIQNSSIIDNSENQMEAAELMIRQALYEASDSDFGSLTPELPVYGYTEFYYTTFLANYWLALDGIWRNAQFEDWEMSYQNNTFVYKAIDVEKQKRRYALSLRKRLFRMEYYSIMYSLHSYEISASNERTNILVESTSLPDNPDSLWEEKIDINTLRKESEGSIQTLITSSFIEEMHYTDYIQQLQIGDTKENIRFTDWLRFKNIIVVLARVFQRIIDNFDVERDWKKFVVLLSRKRLANIFFNVTRLPIETCKTGVNLLVMNTKRRRMEIWDQPLIPLSEEILAFSPRLVQAGDTVRVIENVISEYGGNDLTIRSKYYESYVANIWHEGTKQPVETRLEIISKKYGKIEFDIMIFWQDYLILCEVKCLKSVYNSADEFKAMKSIEYSAKQLQIRKNFICDNWDQLRQSVRTIKLPAKPPKKTKIVCISVTNDMRFTGSTVNGVIVTDSWCLSKYFSSNAFEIYSHNGEVIQQIGSALRFRKSLPNVIELFRYLQNPPQVQRVLSYTHIKQSVLQPINKGESPIFYTVPQYNIPPIPAHLNSKQQKRFYDFIDDVDNQRS